MLVLLLWELEKLGDKMHKIGFMLATLLVATIGFGQTLNPGGIPISAATITNKLTGQSLPPMSIGSATGATMSIFAPAVGATIVTNTTVGGLSISNGVLAGAVTNGINSVNVQMSNTVANSGYWEPVIFQVTTAQVVNPSFVLTNATKDATYYQAFRGYGCGPSVGKQHVAIRINDVSAAAYIHLEVFAFIGTVGAQQEVPLWSYGEFLYTSVATLSGTNMSDLTTFFFSGNGTTCINYSAATPHYVNSDAISADRALYDGGRLMSSTNFWMSKFQLFGTFPSNYTWSVEGQVR